MKKILLAAATIAATATAHADVTSGEEKNAEDPTKIITRAGAGWTNSTASASMAHLALMKRE